MEEVITTIKREKGFDYKIDKNGNLIKTKYNWFKDPYTIITIAIIILGILYYAQISQSATNAKNFDKYCSTYSTIRADYILNNPGQEVTLKNVLNYYDTNKKELDFKFNISNGMG